MAELEEAYAKPLAAPAPNSPTRRRRGSYIPVQPIKPHKGAFKSTRFRQLFPVPSRQNLMELP